MVNGEELIGNTEYLTLYTRCRINRYKWVRLYFHVRRKNVLVSFHSSLRSGVNLSVDELQTSCTTAYMAFIGQALSRT
jgi:hypothetical protein